MGHRRRRRRRRRGEPGSLSSTKSTGNLGEGAIDVGGERRADVGGAGGKKGVVTHFFCLHLKQCSRDVRLLQEEMLREFDLPARAFMEPENFHVTIVPLRMREELVETVLDAARQVLSDLVAQRNQALLGSAPLELQVEINGVSKFGNAVAYGRVALLELAEQFLVELQTSLRDECARLGVLHGSGAKWAPHATIINAKYAKPAPCVISDDILSQYSEFKTSCAVSNITLLGSRDPRNKLYRNCGTLALDVEADLNKQ